MINPPLVTFTLFTYNQEEFIAEAVLSAFAQDYEPLQIILSDDCSTDNTFQIMQDLYAEYTGPHEIILNRNENNLGLAEHINKVIDISNGEIIVISAGDDVSMFNKTTLLVSPMLSNSNIIGVHSAVDEINRAGKFIEKRAIYWNKLDDLEYIVSNGAAVASQAHAFRKKVFEKFGPLNSDVTNEGKVLAFREASLGIIEVLQESTIKYRADVGISSPTIGDVNKITIGDPIKYCNWYLSSLKQIKIDATKLDDLNEELKEIIDKNIKYYELLYSVLEKRWALIPLLKSTVIDDPRKKKIIVAFLRRNAPYFLRKMYVKKKINYDCKKN